MQELSRMQQKIYDYIAAFIQEKGYPPSVREIGDAVGLKSPSTVHFHLKHLEEAGVIEKTANKGRAIVLSDRGERQAAHPLRRPRRLSRSHSGIGCPLWATWPQAVLFWPRSAWRTI